MYMYMYHNKYIEWFHETADKMLVNSKALENFFVRYFMPRKNEPTKWPLSTRRKQGEFISTRRQPNDGTKINNSKPTDTYADYMR